MPTSKLGLRYERLLFFTAPLSFASILVLFLAVALTTQEDRKKAICYEVTAEVVLKNASSLTTLWAKEKYKPGEKYWGLEYKSAINQLAIYAERGAGCYSLLSEDVNAIQGKNPQQVAEEFRKKSQEIQNKPLSYYGVEVPEKASVSFSGSTIRIELSTFTALLQVILGPVLILWLGSISNTRALETRSIAGTKDVTHIFPHLINFYLVSPSRTFKTKRPREIYYYLGHFGFFLIACIRSGMTLLFIAPPSVAYLASLAFLTPQIATWLFVCMGFLILFLMLAAIIPEFQSWALYKRFTQYDEQNSF